MYETKDDMILDLYSQGVSIEDISKESGIAPYLLLESLRKYTKDQKIKGSYSDDILKLIARRDCQGVQRKQIIEELNISRHLLIRAVEKFGLLKTVKPRDTEEFIMNIDGELTECPFCQSKKLNNIETPFFKRITTGKYCVSCGNEMVIDRNKLYKVNWENID